MVVLALAIGFWPAIILSWLFELTPEGLKPDEGVDRDPGHSRKTRERLNQVVIVSLLLAVVYFAADKFILSVEPEVPSEGEIAIAVMPFANQSNDESMVFFSEGVAEDVLGLLAQTPGLRCIARSSSFALRDQSLTVAEIGRQLGVNFVLTGSLRREGDAVRVAVRLEDAESESLVWAENFDGTLDDIFRIQDEISANVVRSVAPTLLNQMPEPESDDDVDAYVAYLAARHLYLGSRSMNPAGVEEAVRQFDAIVEQYPRYARAYAGLADAWGMLAIQGRVPIEEGYSRAKTAATIALELDPGLAEAWFALGDIRSEYDWDLPAAFDAYERGLTIAPRDPEGLRGAAYLSLLAGEFEQALSMYEDVLLLSPNSFRAYIGLFQGNMALERYAEAENLIPKLDSLTPFPVAYSLQSRIYIAEGDYAAIAELAPRPDGWWTERYALAILKRHQGDIPGAERLIETLIGDDGLPQPYITIATYHTRFEEFDKALAALERAVESREIEMVSILSDEKLAPLREDPRFWDLIDQAGIVTLESQLPNARG